MFLAKVEPVEVEAEESGLITITQEARDMGNNMVIVLHPDQVDLLIQHLHQALQSVRSREQGHQEANRD